MMVWVSMSRVISSKLERLEEQPNRRWLGMYMRVYLLAIGIVRAGQSQVATVSAFRTTWLCPTS